VDLFFDGFPSDGTGEFSHKWNHGQPVIAMPIISVDRKGSLTIAFSTGEQEAIGSDPTKPGNYVWSLTEEPSVDRTKLTPKVNWYLALKGALAGDRVIGEMALFSGDLFFSTVGPGTSNDACSSGSGKVWGMHYVDPSAAGACKGGVVSTTLVGLVGSLIRPAALLPPRLMALIPGLVLVVTRSPVGMISWYFPAVAAPPTGFTPYEKKPLSAVVPELSQVGCCATLTPERKAWASLPSSVVAST
jgi:hypothetical protein